MVSISLGDTTNCVKQFSVSLSQSLDGAHHKFFRTESGSIATAVTIALASPWSPIVWEKNQRKKAEFKSCSLVALDIDDGFPLKDAIKWLKSLGFRSSILLSKSHQKEKKTEAGHVSKPCDRFRIIIDAGTVTDLDQYEMNMKYWLAKLPMADKSCKDGARFFFASPQLAYEQDGESYEWGDFHKEIDAERNIIAEMTKKRIAAFQGTGAISEGLKNFIRRGVPAGGRHNACYWLGCVFAELNIGLEESVRMISAGPLGEIGIGHVREAVVYARKKVLGGKG